MVDVRASPSELTKHSESLLMSGRFSDLLISCDTQEFRVHKSHVSLALGPDLRFVREIKIQSCPSEIAWQFLKLLYVGEAHLENENALKDFRCLLNKFGFDEILNPSFSLDSEIKLEEQTLEFNDYTNPIEIRFIKAPASKSEDIKEDFDDFSHFEEFPLDEDDDDLGGDRIGHSLGTQNAIVKTEKKKRRKKRRRDETKTGFKCPICDFVVKPNETSKTRFVNIAVHVKRNHGHDKWQGVKDILLTELAEPLGKFFCQICKKRFKSWIATKSHYTTQHKGVDPEQMKPADMEPYKCDRCAFTTGHMTELDDHILGHTSAGGEKAFVCATCAKSFDMLRKLKAHEKMIHGEKPFKCDKCERCFPKKSRLSRHVLSAHPIAGDKPFKCKVCLECFATNSKLQKHRKEFHPKNLDENKRFKCDYCQKETKDQQALWLHLQQWHKIEPPPMANAPQQPPAVPAPPIPAPQAFIPPQGSNMAAAAMVANHMIDIKPPQDCRLCGTTFIDTMDLRNHMWKIHCSQL